MPTMAELDDRVVDLLKGTVSRFLKSKFDPPVEITNDAEEILVMEANYYLHKIAHLAKAAARRAHRHNLFLNDIHAAIRRYRAFPFHIPQKPVDDPVCRYHWLATNGRAIPSSHTDIPDVPDHPPVPEIVKERVQPVPLPRRLQRTVAGLHVACLSGEVKGVRRIAGRLAKSADLPRCAPYLIGNFQVAVEVGRCEPRRMECMAIVADMLVTNERWAVGLYADRLLPILITVVVTKRVTGHDGTDDVPTRRRCAQLVARLEQRLRAEYPTVCADVCRVAASVLGNPRRAVVAHVGALVLLQHLGAQAVEVVLAPLLPEYARTARCQVVARTESEVRRRELKDLFSALKGALAVAEGGTNEVIQQAIHDMHSIDI